MKILTIVGARPQFIKAALLSRAIRKTGGEITEVLVNTDQHYDKNMSKTFFDELDINAPNYNLNAGSFSALEQVSKMLSQLEGILQKEDPDRVLVYGDTNSTLAGALAASKLGYPLDHVEAGLRSYDKSMPEEINRIVTDHISSSLFCPTKTAVMNLEKENIKDNVFQVGDIMHELALEISGKTAKSSSILEDLRIKSGEYILATVHRQSNADNSSKLENIIKAFEESDLKIIWPMHPRTKKMLKIFGLTDRVDKCGNISVTPPIGYIDMIRLEQNACKIVTDSGGVQKEAYFFKVPCVTVREQTEWVETLENGWNILTGADTEKIVNAVQNRESPGKYQEFYGQGDTSKQIVKILKRGV